MPSMLLVSTLAFIMIVSGVASTHLPVVVLGEVFAGGISMAYRLTT